MKSVKGVKGAATMNNYICTNEKAAAMCTHNCSTCIWGTLDTACKVAPVDDASDNNDNNNEEGEDNKNNAEESEWEI